MKKVLLSLALVLFVFIGNKAVLSMENGYDELVENASIEMLTHHKISVEEKVLVPTQQLLEGDVENIEVEYELAIEDGYDLLLHIDQFAISRIDGIYTGFAEYFNFGYTLEEIEDSDVTFQNLEENVTMYKLVLTVSLNYDKPIEELQQLRGGLTFDLILRIY